MVIHKQRLKEANTGRSARYWLRNMNGGMEKMVKAFDGLMSGKRQTGVFGRV